MTEEEYSQLVVLAKAAAKRVSFQWPDVIEADDLTQDMIVRLMESPGMTARLFTEDEATRKSFMIRVAHQTASDEMVDYDRFSGNYLYDTVEVRTYLEGQLWILDTDRFSAEKADLTEGLNNLADKGSNHYAEIINRFQFETIPDSSDSTGRMRIVRAVEALTEEMNKIGANRRRDRIEGPGTRKVGSSTAAIRGTSTDWQGELSEGRH